MTMNKRDRMLLAVIAVIAVIGGAYWFLIKPAKAEATAKRGELQSIQDELDMVREQIARLQAEAKDEVPRTVEGLRLAKAVPTETAVPGAILQLQRMAQQTDVELSALRTSSVSTLGTLRVVELETQVTGRFFDVDDFLFRAHRMVTVNAKNEPRVTGRLFAVKAVQLNVAEADPNKADTGDKVEGVMQILVFAAPRPAASDTAAATPGVTQ